MKVIDVEAMEWAPVPVNTRSMKLSRKLLREDEILPEIRYSNFIIRFEGGDDVFTTPRHRHEFAQLRYTLKGSQDFGDGLIAPEGWVGFFPVGAYYGPQRTEDSQTFQVQWGRDWVTVEQTEQGIAKLTSEGGVFDKGIYSYADADGRVHRKDAVNAVWEAVYGRELVIPEPEYPMAILMNPDAFEWQSYKPGMSIKRLGEFSGAGVAVQILRWDEPGEHRLAAGRTEMALCREGTIEVDSIAYGENAVVWSDLDEDVVIKGEAGSEILLYLFPKAAAEER